MILRRSGRGGFNGRSGGRTRLADTALTILAAAGRLRHGNAAAHRGRDREDLGHDEQQAEYDGGELFHDVPEITS